MRQKGRGKIVVTIIMRLLQTIMSERKVKRRRKRIPDFFLKVIAVKYVLVSAN